ncbi:MAG: NifB/NifX family molybdenum-iron cluster-binding protein [Bacillota bacterium]
MKIAVPNNNGKVNQHFGRSLEFAVVEVEGQRVVKQWAVSAESLQHNHGGLADLLSGQGVEAVVVGGIGPFALQALEQKGLKVITGASGDIREVAEQYARGELVSEGVACGQHHHDHGGHNHGHGCHHHGHDHRHGHCGHNHGHDGHKCK